VLDKNPRLRAAQHGREAAATQLDQAELKPQWSVALEVENILGTGVLSGIDAGETTIRLSRIFQRSDIRSGRVSVASAQGNQVENGLEAERLELMTLLAHRFLAVVYQQEILKLAELSVTVWQHARSLAENRELAGAAPAVDRLRTEIRLADASLQLEAAERELQAARVMLAATWGDRVPEFGTADAPICHLATLPTFEMVAANIDRNPDLLRFASEQQLYAAQAQLATARRQPEWSVSAGVRRIELLDEQALVLSISVPLGAPSRAAPALRRANALRQQSSFQEQNERLDIRATLFALYQQLLHTGTEVNLFDDEILPRSDEILKQVENGYRVGRFSHLALMNAQAEVLAARAAKLVACSDHHLYLIRIERLTGGGPIWLAVDEGVAP
jgi:cobalt-zinc-cadmium efflux system outer membrane protein